jgi:predicted phosphohydrolase
MSIRFRSYTVHTMAIELQYCSDLHLEFKENQAWLQNNMLQPIANILIMAGDIVCFSELDKADWFFDWVSDNFKETYWIPGNHEYYNSSIGEASSFEQKIRHNVTLINNASVEIGDVVIHFSTLWTVIPEKYSKIIGLQMSDYHLIKINGETLTPSDTNMIHLNAKGFIEKSLKLNSSKKQVVVTHHVPTFANYPIEFVGSPLNSAFAVELGQLISELQPYAWIFGHSHRNVSNFYIGKTQMLTNQLGYVFHNEQKSFNLEASVKV